VAYDAGTHWYHSHVDFQIDNGAAGVIIVRDPNDPYYTPIENEVPIMLQDWYHGSPMDGWEDFKVLRPSLTFPSTGDQPVAGQLTIVPETMMINGKGNFDCSVATATFHNCSWKSRFNYPSFTMNQNDEYRLRFVAGGGSSYAPMDVCIGPNAEMMTVIASDGQDIKPLRANCFQINAGQRIDAIWKATANVDQRKGMFLRVRTKLPVDRAFLTGYAQINVMNVRGESVIGSCNKACGTTRVGALECDCTADCVRLGDCCPDYLQYCDDIPMLPNTLLGDDDGFPSIYNLVFLNEFDFKHRRTQNLEPYPSNNYQRETITTYGMADFNATSAHFSHPEPLLLAWYHGKNDFPNHVSYVKRGTTVDWIFINKGDMIHPLHFHGYKFWLLGSEYGVQAAPATFNPDTDWGKLNFVDPPMRDSYDMPSYGWVVVRWVANNPGAWVFHCHIEAHLMMGMAFVVLVGDPDPMDPSSGKLLPLSVPPPPEEFTQCYNAVDDCPVGSFDCPCTKGGGCDNGLGCVPRWPKSDNVWNTVCRGSSEADAYRSSSGGNSGSVYLKGGPAYLEPSESLTFHDKVGFSATRTREDIEQALLAASSQVVGGDTCESTKYMNKPRSNIACKDSDSPCQGVGFCSVNRGRCLPWQERCESCNAVKKCRPGLICNSANRCNTQE
jgi:FtsP/CotA-like multicopper oxidase with cupredoxin domain